MNSPNKTATLADVARYAGVHVGTASMVLNGAASNTRVAPATRQRIEDAAQSLHYFSNRVARGLKRARMECIGLIFPAQSSALTMGNAFGPPLLQGVIEAAAEVSYNVTHCHKRWRDSATSATGFLGQGIDGFVVVAPPLDSDIVAGLTDLGMPVVVLAAASQRKQALSIIVDNAVGVDLAVGHLLERGHRRIAHLVSDSIHSDTHARRTAFLAALGAAGLTGEVVVSSYAEGRFHADALALLHQRNRPTAVFTTNDAAAFAVAQAARDLGLTVPGDLSIVGFDDFPAAAYTTPPLTTIRQPLFEMGAAAARALISLVEGRSADSRVFAPTLIVRGSTAPPPAPSRARRPRRPILGAPTMRYPIILLASTLAALAAADSPEVKLPAKVDQEYHAYLASLVKAFQGETAKFEARLKRDATAAKKDADATAAIAALQDRLKDGRHLQEFTALVAGHSGPESGGSTVQARAVSAEDQDKAIAELQKLGGRLKLEGRNAVSADLADLDIKDEALVYLDSLPQLKTLSLRHGYKVTAAGLVHLRGLLHLETLDVWDLKTAMHDDQLPLLVRALPQLKSLNLGGCPLSNDALACLEGNTQLTELTLTYTNVTDAGLNHLTTLSGLQTLAFGATKVTDDGVKKLQEALPSCKISR